MSEKRIPVSMEIGTYRKLHITCDIADLSDVLSKIDFTIWKLHRITFNREYCNLTLGTHHHERVAYEDFAK